MVLVIRFRFSMNIGCICWSVPSSQSFNVFCEFQEKYGIEPTMVVQGVKMLYVPVMPGHIKRLKLT